MNFGKDGGRSFYQLSNSVRSETRIKETTDHWPMAKVVQVHKDSEGVVRSVRLLAGKTRSGQDE